MGWWEKELQASAWILSEHIMIVETFHSQLLMKPFKFEECVCRLAFFTTAIEKKKIKETCFLVFIILN
jgi:hypothetical protein